MERVQSKHLFNNQLYGVVSPDVAELMAKYKEKQRQPDDDNVFGNMMKPWTMTCQQYAEGIRRAVAVQAGLLREHPTFLEAIQNCSHSEFEVHPRDGNIAAVRVVVHTPKGLLSQKDNPAVVYAHGGGVVSGTPEHYQPFVSYIASLCGVVVFNVDYRLAPETKCPHNALDFYCAVKHVVENACSLGVDPKRIAIFGESGGGYIVMATMVMLAQKDEGHLVKLAIPSVPMIDDYCFADPRSMLKQEREYAPVMKKVWECLATDIKKQREDSDPLLFPAKADDEILARMPPTIIWEAEFDLFITEATRMARRLRSLGRLLELYVAPGAFHGNDRQPDLKIFTEAKRDFKLALDTYLI